MNIAVVTDIEGMELIYCVRHDEFQELLAWGNENDVTFHVVRTFHALTLHWITVTHNHALFSLRWL